MSHTPLSIPVIECHSMGQVRAHIDALDGKIVALMAERSGYVAQAARIKSSADKIVDHPRIDYIIDRVRSMARGHGAPEDVVAESYRAMIAASIEFERSEFKRLKGEG